MRTKNVGYMLILVLMLNAFVLASTIPASEAQTYHEVNGMISSNVTLKAADGPYSFGEVVVASGATLTIEAGSTISGGNLQVDGALIAKGTSNNKIYFNFAAITFTSTSTTSCTIEYTNLFYSSVSISGKATIKNCFIQASQAIATLTVTGGSPTISHNTLKGSLDASRVISVFGGSPTITGNNIIAFVDNGLYPNPPAGMNRFGTANGIYVENGNEVTITNNNFYGPFRDSSIKVVKGTATINGNNDYPTQTIDYPTPTPPPPTPTPTPSPTLPPYPPPSTSATPTAAPTEGTITPTSTPTSDDGLYETVIIVIIASIIINALLVIAVAYLLKKRKT